MKIGQIDGRIKRKHKSLSVVVRYITTKESYVTAKVKKENMYDDLKLGGPVDKPSTHRNTTLGNCIPKL